MEHPSPQSVNNEHSYQFRIPEMMVAIVRELFVMLFCTYFVSMTVDALADSFVSKVFDTDILLWPLLIVGALAVLLYPLASADDGTRSKYWIGSQYVIVIVAGAIVGAVVWAKTNTLGTLGLVYALASAAIIAILSYTLLNESETTDHSSP